MWCTGVTVTLGTLWCTPGVDSTKVDKTGSGSHQVVFELGSTEELTQLYSYPNSYDDKDTTLEQTVEHYLSQSLDRDLTINGRADVTVDGDTYKIIISGDGEHVEQYDEQINSFLSSGKLALQAVSDMKRDKIWNENDWRFFLPHGLSITKQRSIQLLHFPPDYSLTEQDYLNSKTSKRWEELLKLNDIGLDDVTLYEAILDIAPIAAPADAGSTLNDTYTYFEPYVLAMLPVLLKNRSLPIVAYGGPVRRWVTNFYKLDDYLGVNSVETIDVTNTISVPFLGANHPSYIWYAKDDGRKKAFEVMEQDLISACWQAHMGSNPDQGSNDVLQECIKNWNDQPMIVCINMEIQAFGKSEAEAQEECQNDLPGDKRKSEL